MLALAQKRGPPPPRLDVAWCTGAMQIALHDAMQCVHHIHTRCLPVRMFALQVQENADALSLGKGTTASPVLNVSDVVIAMVEVGRRIFGRLWPDA